VASTVVIIVYRQMRLVWQHAAPNCDHFDSLDVPALATKALQAAALGVPRPHRSGRSATRAWDGSGLQSPEKQTARYDPYGSSPGSLPKLMALGAVQMAVRRRN
jgi:hypothetical protein